MAFEDYFSVQVFFLIFRETLETAIIVSVLLTFLKRGFAGSEVAGDKVYRKLVVQVWVGAVLGLIICFVIGALFIFVFYYLGKNLWNVTEKIWEATFSIVASVIITAMGLAMLRINKMKQKWRFKLAKIIIATHEGKPGFGIRRLSRKYAMALLPLVTTLREGLEAVVFLGGMGINTPASSFPLPVILAVVLGSIVGVCMYKYGNHVSIHYFLVGSTCFLYLVAAGLFSRGVWFIELQQFINKIGQDVSESGSGPGSYDITRSVWHVNCCNAQTDGPWMVFNALLGWQNSATYGSVISYNLYWWFVIVLIFITRYKETHGRLPFIPASWQGRRKHLVVNEREAQDLLNRATEIYTENPSHDEVPRDSMDSAHSSSPLIQG
jgi:high-affinity iron transporter